MPPRDPGLGLYEPEPRTTTDLTVAYFDDRPPVSLTLPGNFEPETLSVDEETLYLLQYEPALDPEHYLVVELDLASGEIASVRSPQVDIQPEMRGVARAQAIAPDGDHLYTLYTLPPDADPVHDVGATGATERWAFVHVLDVDAGYDFCIFLPVPMGTADEASLAVGLSPDGRVLYVVDPSTALVARMDTEMLEITSVHEVGELRNATSRPEIAVGDDGTLFVGYQRRGGGHELHAFAPGDGGMHRHRSAIVTEPITGIDLSADGTQLRVVQGADVHAVDPATFETELVMRSPGDTTVEILGRLDQRDPVGWKLW